ncbi:hypothetical protein OH76DRAFT_1141495 [Lentinus brumalis]|uniref:Uncharacterized protein n=1 Tax=Lentinus brumalis TaxID=2498619 RepID=A0A371DMC2_9APHY|nr:hypothetical protein OH76DRAFT_1141495 [Polyporus brumalis]
MPPAGQRGPRTGEFPVPREFLSCVNLTRGRSSFFDNKGAVAGVFSVAAIVVFGAIITAIVLAKRRAARLQDEEDMTYFEKYPNPQENNRSASPTSFTGGFDNLNSTDTPMSHAATDAYPDRAMHYGLPTMAEYNQPQPMEINFNNAVDYPPGMAYNPAQYGGYEGAYGNAAAAQQYAGYQGGQQQQYAGGYEGGQQYAGGYDAAAAQQDAYYAQPSHSPTHPYANPSNSPRGAGAPAVQHYVQPGEDAGYYGEAR